MKSGFLSDFSLRLKEERKRLGLNQAGFGAAGGVSKDAQLNYESGARAPDAAYLHGVAAAGVDVLYLLTGQRTPVLVTDGLPADVSELVNAYAAVGEDAKATLQAVALLAVKGLRTDESARAGNTVTIGGDVGQSVAGDATFSAPVSFTGKRK